MSSLWGCVKVLFVAVIAIIIPNLLMGGVAYYLGVDRPLVNFDYAIPVFLFALGWRKISALLMLLLSTVDLISLVGQSLSFMQLTDVPEMLSMIKEAPITYQLLLVAGLLIPCLQWFLTHKSSQYLRSGALLFSVNLIILGFVAESLLSPSKQYWLLDSQTSYFLSSPQLVGGLLNPPPVHYFPLDPAGAATGHWPAMQMATQQAHRMLLVVSESWGVPANPAVQEALLGPLLQLNDRNIQQGQLSFSGGTSRAELRELCHMGTDLIYFNHALPESMAGCFPHHLKAAGYRVRSMHAGGKGMYERDIWYPLVGFEDSIFRESRDWPVQCFSWPGACDLDMRSLVAEFFGKSDREFLYWLTLNSHHPYDLRDLRYEHFDCARFGIDPGVESCRNLKLQAQFLSGLVELLRQPEMQNVEVMVVGDHTPRLIRKNETVFIEGQVPWILLGVSEDGRPAAR